MRVLYFTVVLAFFILYSGCRSRVGTSDDSPVTYSATSRDSLSRLSIRRITVDDSAVARIATFSRTNSPWGSRWVACDLADTLHHGPWTTRLYIFTGTDSHRCIEVEARDHANGGVQYEWLSDKALFVRCWWGRIVSTDFVLDTESGNPVYIQDADYFRLILPPER
jgi:hypothetical protein